MNASHTPLIAQAEAGKVLGMDLAARAKEEQILRGKIALLRAILTSPDGIATIDDATSDLSAKFPDGGKWRGSVPLSLAMSGIIEKVDMTLSTRPSRHRGSIGRWRIRDSRRATVCLTRLLATLDWRLQIAAEAASPSQKSEAPTVAPVEASSQKTFPQFNEKGLSDG